MIITQASLVWALSLSILLAHFISVSALAFNSTVAGLVSPAAFTNASFSTEQSGVDEASLTRSSIWGTSQVTRSGSDLDGVDEASLTRFPERDVIKGYFDTGMHEEGEPTRTPGAPWDTVFVIGTDTPGEDEASMTRSPRHRGQFDTGMLNPFDTGMHKPSESRTHPVTPWDTVFVLGTYVPEEDEPSTTQSPLFSTGISSSSDRDKVRGLDYTVPPWLRPQNVSSTGSSLGNMTRHNTTRASLQGAAISFSNVRSTVAISTVTQSFILTSVIPYSSDGDEEAESTMIKAPETVTADPLPMSTTVTKTIAGYRVLIIPAHEYMYDASNDSETVVATTTVYSDPSTSMATGNATGATPKRVHDLARIIIPTVGTGVVMGLALTLAFTEWMHKDMQNAVKDFPEVDNVDELIEDVINVGYKNPKPSKSTERAVQLEKHIVRKEIKRRGTRFTKTQWKRFTIRFPNLASWLDTISPPPGCKVLCPPPEPGPERPMGPFGPYLTPRPPRYPKPPKGPQPRPPKNPKGPENPPIELETPSPSPPPTPNPPTPSELSDIFRKLTDPYEWTKHLTNHRRPSNYETPDPYAKPTPSPRAPTPTPTPPASSPSPSCCCPKMLCVGDPCADCFPDPANPEPTPTEDSATAPAKPEPNPAEDSATGPPNPADDTSYGPNWNSETVNLDPDPITTPTRRHRRTHTWFLAPETQPAVEASKPTKAVRGDGAGGEGEGRGGDRAGRKREERRGKPDAAV